MSPAAARCELRIRLKENAFVTQKKLSTTNAVVGTRLEGQIGTVIWSLARLIL
jgi:hypothetical protein